MEKGKRVFSETVDDARERCAASLERLPQEVARITDPAPYLVRTSQKLKNQIGAVQQKAQEQVLNH